MVGLYCCAESALARPSVAGRGMAVVGGRSMFDMRGASDKSCLSSSWD